MAGMKEWNRTKRGKIKSVKKEYEGQLATQLADMKAGKPVGGSFQEFQAEAGTPIGMAVGDTPRGLAQTQLAQGGNVGATQEAIRQAGGEADAMSKMLQQYKAGELQAQMARQQMVTAGMEKARTERRQDRAEAQAAVDSAIAAAQVATSAMNPLPTGGGSTPT